MANDSSSLRALVTRLAGHQSEVTSFVDFMDETSFWTSHRIGHQQLNELLLSLAYDTVSNAFFERFFPIDSEASQGLGREEFIRAIDDFEQVSLLKYGNVKFGFKRLGQMTANDLEAELDDIRSVELDVYTRRPPPLRRIEALDLHETHFLGHVTGDAIARGTREDLKSELDRCRKVGAENLNIYLTSDELDVYVATSMRDVEDFYFVGYAVQTLFSKPMLKEMNLRYFDPTQAYCVPRIDKGLVESLMLRRAKCTVYCAQTTETLGKDSELAVTLAQGKPVVVYAPEIKENERHYRKLCREAAELHSRIHGGSISDCYRSKLIERHAKSLGTEVRELWDWNEAVLLNRLVELDDALFERKALLLKDKHPLGVQVDLNTGVANGVLVARTLTVCAELIRAIMTNTLTFRTEYDEDGTRRLVEEKTDCTYRLMVGDPILTNSFWNFYRPWIRR